MHSSNSFFYIKILSAVFIWLVKFWTMQTTQNFIIFMNFFNALLIVKTKKSILKYRKIHFKRAQQQCVEWKEYFLYSYTKMVFCSNAVTSFLFIFHFPEIKMLKWNYYLKKFVLIERLHELRLHFIHGRKKEKNRQFFINNSCRLTSNYVYVSLFHIFLLFVWSINFHNAWKKS